MSRLPNLDCGDIIVEDSGHLGMDFISIFTGDQIMFLNEASCKALLEWLKRKYDNRN